MSTDRPAARTRSALPLLGPRDPAQPLLTLLDGPARVELSGATTTNWAAKTANLLRTTSTADRVGLLLPLHWQAVTLLLGTLAAGATAVVARSPDDLADCDVAFAAADAAQEALDACSGDVYAVSPAPLGGRLRDLPPLVLDAGVELPVQGDALLTAAPRSWRVELAGAAYETAPDLGIGPADRVLTALPPSTADGLAVLLGALAHGSALVLAPTPPDPGAVAAEQITASAGVVVPGVRTLT
ncbi:MAG: TIGR03089 family protein [Actinomycetota bacterium]|nr:TIGR03089 family protein [Actinomycetota bacterium]